LLQRRVNVDEDDEAADSFRREVGIFMTIAAAARQH